jgi:hypothetical protein
MFEETSDGVLIDVMGEATRDESTASAQWMLAVVSYMPGALRSCLRLSGGAAIPRMRWPRRYRRRRTSASPARWARFTTGGRYVSGFLRRPRYSPRE